MDKNLQKLNNLLEIMETDKVTVSDLEEVIALFTKVVQDVKREFKSSIENKIGRDELGKSIEQIRISINDFESRLKGIIEKSEKISQSRLSELSQEIEQIKLFQSSLPSLSSLEEQAQEFEKKIPIELSGEKIVEKINDLPIEEDKQIDIEHIKGWKEWLLEQIGKIRGDTIRVIGGPSGGGKIVKVYDLSASLDGVTKTFALPAFWRVISIQSTSFPFAFRPTTDYTTDASAMTITFTSEVEASSTLASGQTLLVIYSE